MVALFTAGGLLAPGQCLDPCQVQEAPLGLRVALRQNDQLDGMRPRGQPGEVSLGWLSPDGVVLAEDAHRLAVNLHLPARAVVIV